MNENMKLHIVMFPWLAFGHIIPYFELSKQLASRGHHIFFVSAPRNLQRLPKIPENIAHLITLVPLPLPRVEGLPPNAEATTDVGFEMGGDLLKKAYDGLQEPMSKFLEASSLSNSLDWIIYDFSCHWLPPIADKLNIRKVYFCICFARTISALGPSSCMLKEDSGSTWTDLCSPVYFSPHEARLMFYGLRHINSTGFSDLFRYKTCVTGSDLIAVRSCMEIEAEFVQQVEKFEEKAVFPVGLLPPLEDSVGDESWELINGWLERHRKGSVVYVAFGSEFELSQAQLTELALGLEISQLPFFWAFRRSGVSSLELPVGFEERTGDRGMVWKSWAPQLRILSHDTIGGFLTHCGWSSIIEALQFGKPLIMLPLAIDHGLYARFITEKNAGIEIPRNEEDGSITRNSVAESLKFVLQDEAGKILKVEADNLRAIFANKSLHEQYIDKFSEYLCNHKPRNVE